MAELLLKEAARQRRRVEVVEWPGSNPTAHTKIPVTPSIMKKVAGGRKSSLPLRTSVNLKEFAGLPWGSVVQLQAGEHMLPIVSGPAKYHHDWCLQVVHHGKMGGDAKRLKKWGVRFREKKGLEYRRFLEGSIHTR